MQCHSQGRERSVEAQARTARVNNQVSLPLLGELDLSLCNEGTSDEIEQIDTAPRLVTAYRYL